MIRSLLLCLLVALTSVVAFAQTTVIPKDVVDLKCVEDPTLDGEYTISDDGNILLQYIGALKVSGLSATAAAAKISKELVAQQILRKATVTLRIKTEARPEITVGGAVGRGGALPHRAGMRLSEALEWANPTSVADLSKIRITSRGGQTTTADRTRNENPELQAGDQVFIPLKAAGGEFTVLGAVAKPGLFPFQPGWSVRDAIDAAGGLRSDADPNRVTVRHADGNQRVLDLNLPESNIVLTAGDTVVVAQRAMDEQVYVRGAISKPGLLSYRPGLTISQVVGDAGPVEGARLDRVKIIRKVEGGKSETISVNLAKVMRGETPDEPLIAGDIVDVPYPGKSFGFREGLQIAGLILLLLTLLK
ncbi:MAG: SLBB domain-containing protein [Fimbriimonadales bacterium]